MATPETSETFHSNAAAPTAALADGMQLLMPLLDVLARCHRAARESISDVTHRHGMTDSEFHLLWVCRVWEADPPSQNDLAQALAISPAQVSCLVEQLRQKQWITGTRSAVDRRRQVWRLTDEGANALEAVATVLRQFTDRLVSRLSVPALQALTDRLRGLYGALSSLEHTWGEAA
jgi:DNA-binding MarR family transcriptional regulator